MHVTRDPQYSEEFPHIINTKELHFRTAVQITSACTCKDLSQLTQFLCKCHQRNKTIHTHIVLGPANGHLSEKVQEGEHVQFLTMPAENQCIRFKGSPLLHRPERLSQWIYALKQNHQDQKCPKFNLKSHNSAAEPPFSHHTHLPKASLSCQREGFYIHHRLTTGST